MSSSWMSIQRTWESNKLSTCTLLKGHLLLILFFCDFEIRQYSA